MNHHRLLASTACSCALGALSVAAHATTYHITDLGIGGGAAINAAGAVAGSHSTTGLDFTPALYAQGKVTDLGSLGGNSGVASGIADDGTIVGQSMTALSVFHAFRSVGGVMKDLGTLASSKSSMSAAVGINRKGHVCGSSYTDGGVWHFFLVKGWAMKDIGAPAGSEGAYASACNNKDDIVGSAFAPVTGNPHAVLYHDHQFTDLGDFAAGAGYSNALGVNDHDEVVGMASAGTNGSSAPLTAFYWKAGKMRNLGVLPGSAGIFSAAYAIANDGTVVGASAVTPTNSVTAAFVYKRGVMTDMNKLLDASSAGWHLDSAAAINPAGQITGVGTIHGASHVFLATPLD